MTTTETANPGVDPLAHVEVGDDDPIGAFDDDNVCGAQIKTGANSWNTAECTREPHPPGWAHISTCDDRVEEVWFDGLGPLDPTKVRLNGEGLVCTECGMEQTANLSENHYSGCPHATQ